MTMRPDPTFHASPKLAMEAPPEDFAHTLLARPECHGPCLSVSLRTTLLNGIMIPSRKR